MEDLVFEVVQETDGGFCAECLTENIFDRVHQVGSHVILETSVPHHQRIAVPAHNRVKVGTLNSILRAVADHKGVSRDDIIRTL